ncbi:hypothetical protein P43SY_009776 [Pythium insidiosum]|uniref:Ion transport domain-containing protein n=1 Tax=Pythium insidiosum TaxID=114742 RepID=A0AAD5LMN0_PYTIN|nr:hypothetical protein P43SY_009776 [Pythium insidiosum]
MSKVVQDKKANRDQSDDDEEVEVEIRGPAAVSAVSPGGGEVIQFTERPTAIEMDDGTPEVEAPTTMRTRMKRFFRLPNDAIKETWSRLDLPDELTDMISISVEQEEYGERRDGEFWKLVHETLFGSNTRQGQICGIVLFLLITTSVLLAIMDSVHQIRAEYGDIIYAIEAVFTVIFAIEYVLRVWCLRRPSEYICSAMGIVDISSILPTIITFFLPPARPLADLATLRIFRVIRVFRVLRLVRFVDAARALKDNIDANKLRVAVFMFFVFSMIVVIGCAMYLIEGEANGFTNIPVSLYWAVVTLTTVGYGDIAPQTVPGRLLAAVVMFSGYGVIACPLVLNTQTEEEALRLNCECYKCFRGLHQDDANFCRHCGTALRLPKSKQRKLRKKKSTNSDNQSDAEVSSVQPMPVRAVELEPPKVEAT